MTETSAMETIGDITVLRLREPAMMEFHNIARTAQLCEKFLRNSPTSKTLIDFGQIEFSNSLALGMIASLRQKGSRCGRTVSLCNLHPRTLWAIQAMRLHGILDIYYDEELALSMMQPGLFAHVHQTGRRAFHKAHAELNKAPNPACFVETG